MKKRKLKNKMKNLITSLIIFTILLITGYFGIGYLEEEAQVTSSNKIENIENINFEDGKLNIMFFYVGQADSTFIKINDCTMLIDAGNNEDGENIANFLKEKKIEKINYLIGTHADEDHIGGLDDILNSLNVEKLYITTVGSEGKDYQNAINAAKDKNIEIIHPVRGDEILLDDVRCEIMSAVEGENVTDNNSSIVIEMSYNKTKYLFMGDAEKEVENSRSWNKVDILKVGHHGSNSSSSSTFLKQVNPSYSIIEVGKNNSYNLPSDKTISRLESIKTNILRTDKLINNEPGSLLVTSDGNSINIEKVNINLDGN